MIVYFLVKNSKSCTASLKVNLRKVSVVAVHGPAAERIGFCKQGLRIQSLIAVRICLHNITNEFYILALLCSLGTTKKGIGPTYAAKVIYDWT